jgi:hypothetical protein
MSEAKKIENEAPDYIETIIADMLKGNHPDNKVLLGELLDGNTEIQVQLLVTTNKKQFIDEMGSPMFINFETE